MALSRITIQGIQAEEAQDWWPKVAKWCEAALAHGGDLLNLDDVKQGVADREMQLWVIHEWRDLKAVCVTSINVWPRAKVLTAIIVGGEEMDKWVEPLVDLLVRYGRAEGCKTVDAHGRRGWTKTLRSLGWRDSIVTFSKEVEHG
jgi:hypothetical protein